MFFVFRVLLYLRCISFVMYPKNRGYHFLNFLHDRYLVECRKRRVIKSSAANWGSFWNYWSFRLCCASHNLTLLREPVYRSARLLAVSADRNSQQQLVKLEIYSYACTQPGKVVPLFGAHFFQVHRHVQTLLMTGARAYTC